MTRKFLPLLAILLLFHLTAYSQVKFGLGIGMSSVDIAPSDLVITNSSGSQQLLMQLESANYGVHAGMALRIMIKKFFIQPQVFLNASSADFRLEDLQGGNLPSKVFREKYQNLDLIPLFGYKLGPLRLQAGPVAHYFLACQSDLDEIPDYQKVFEEFTYGYQAGIGLDIWKIFIDLSYEGNFSRFGEHINVFGKKFAFDKNPARFVVTAGYFF